MKRRFQNNATAMRSSILQGGWHNRLYNPESCEGQDAFSEIFSPFQNPTIAPSEIARLFLPLGTILQHVLQSLINRLPWRVLVGRPRSSVQVLTKLFILTEALLIAFLFIEGYY